MSKFKSDIDMILLNKHIKMANETTKQHKIGTEKKKPGFFGSLKMSFSKVSTNSTKEVSYKNV